MKVYLYDRDLAFFLFPGRPFVDVGAVASERRVIADQRSHDADAEHAKLASTYDDAVLLVRDRSAADLVMSTPLDVATYLADRGYLKESKRASRWLKRAEPEDALAALKLSLARGRWDWDAMKKRAGVYRLYDAVSKCRRGDVVEAWFDVVDDMPPGAVTACLVSFAARAAAGEEPGSTWMKAAMARARRMCDLSTDALASVLLAEEGVPLDAAGLAAALSLARSLGG